MELGDGSDVGPSRLGEVGAAACKGKNGVCLPHQTSSPQLQGTPENLVCPQWCLQVRCACTPATAPALTIQLRKSRGSLIALRVMTSSPKLLKCNHNTVLAYGRGDFAAPAAMSALKYSIMPRVSTKLRPSDSM